MGNRKSLQEVMRGHPAANGYANGESNTREGNWKPISMAGDTGKREISSEF
jgi:hypothetical protein